MLLGSARESAGCSWVLPEKQLGALLQDLCTVCMCEEGVTVTLPPLAALRGTLGSCPRCFRLPFLAVSQSRSVSFPVPRREGNFSLYQKWMGFFWSSE